MSPTVTLTSASADHHLNYQAKTMLGSLHRVQVYKACCWEEDALPNEVDLGAFKQ